MMKKILFGLLLVTTLLPAMNTVATAASKTGKATSTLVRIKTSMGVIDVKLDPVKAPVTVANFLRYTRDKKYDGTIFHRVIRNFMIQTGGFEPRMRKREAYGPIKNEADNGLKNLAGTLAMARTNDPHSASNQFFINAVDNAFLDHKSKTSRGWGYAVFGKVVKGMDVVKAIETVPTTRNGYFGDTPVKDITIISVREIKKKR